MAGAAATDGLGLLSVGLLVGHAAPDAAIGSVIVAAVPVCVMLCGFDFHETFDF